MSKRAIFFLVGYVGFLVAAVIFPPAGVWGYFFEWYHHPPYHWWGDNIPDFVGGRWSFAIGLAMGVGLLLHYGKYASTPFLRYPQTKLIILYTANAFAVSWLMAGEESFGVAMEHLKMLVVYWCIVKTHANLRYVHVLLVISILGCAEFGWDALGTGAGRELGLGGPGTIGENFVSAHVIAFIPLVAWYALTEKGWVRWACLASAPLMVNLVAESESRGAFIALVTAMVATVAVVRGRMRAWATVGAIVGVLVMAALFHEDYLERIQTIATYEEDGSATGRLEAWSAAWKLTVEHPFGYGGESFDLGLGARHMPTGFHTTHNMFFEILVAWGVQGVIFFFGFILLSLRDAWRHYGERWDGESWPPPRDAVIAVAIVAGILSMLTAAMFLNRYRWELWWMYAGIVVCLRNVKATQEVESDEASPRPALAKRRVPGRAGAPVTRHRGTAGPAGR